MVINPVYITLNNIKGLIISTILQTREKTFFRINTDFYQTSVQSKDMEGQDILKLWTIYTKGRGQKQYRGHKAGQPHCKGNKTTLPPFTLAY